MLIRRATLEDLDSIAKVHVDTWRSAYRGIVPDAYLDGLSYDGSKSVWRRAIERTDRGAGVFVAQEEGGAVVGFASFGPERSGDPTYDGELYAVYVLKGSERKGAGSRLVGAAANELLQNGFHSMLLWILVDNPSRGFYERLGGRYLRSQLIDIGGTKLQEVSYGWTDLLTLQKLVQAWLGHSNS